MRCGPDAAAHARGRGAAGDDGERPEGGVMGGRWSGGWMVLGGAALLSVGPTVRLSVAQTGHEPGQSPYRDIRGGGVVVFGVGYLGGSRGRAGVGMADGISWNVRYDASLGGPVSTSPGLAYAQTPRYLLDPTKDAATRTQGPVDTDVILADRSEERRVGKE